MTYVEFDENKQSVHQFWYLKDVQRTAIVFCLPSLSLISHVCA